MRYSYHLRVNLLTPLAESNESARGLFLRPALLPASLSGRDRSPAMLSDGV